MSGTYLTALTSEMYDRKWQRYFVRRPARLMSVSTGLSGVTMRTATVIDISRGGASIEIDTAAGLGTHYYLEILGLSTRIGCAQAFLNGTRAGVKFIMPISETLLQRVIRADFVMGGNLDEHSKSIRPGIGQLQR